MTVGCCECRLCGLRGYSKNVLTRSVFPIFDGRHFMLETYESCIRARKDTENPDQWMFGSNSRDWAKDDTPYDGLAETLIRYLKFPGTSIDDLRILLCVHDWVQDEGTESV